MNGAEKAARTTGDVGSPEQDGTMGTHYKTGFMISLLIMGLMALAAELTGRQEIIFPETAALLTGSFLVQRRPWNVRHGIYTLEMSLCALTGIVISRYMDTPLYFKVLLAVILVSCLLILTRTTMLPAISASALPILIGTTDFIYVAAVIVIAAVCDLGNYLMENKMMMDPVGYFPARPDVGHWIRMIFIFALALTVPMLSGFKFMAAPPMIVAFVAFSTPGNLKGNRPVRMVLLFTGAALTGYLCRSLADGTVLPATVCVMIAAAAVWTLLRLLKRFFPPAAAIGILPFILPEEGLWKYPLEIMVGIILLYAAAALLSLWEEKRTGEC
ncbi:MAG: hypothetical protein IKD86_06645 [Firmicutes bacterium]|nr:hypothetical protein [Bacillota bacterium]